MPVLTSGRWRVVFRGRLTALMLDQLSAAGIEPCGSSSYSGRAGRGGLELHDYPFSVEARNADDAFVRLTQALGEGYTSSVRETPTLLRD
jgi:hypothetical protein